MVSPPAHGALYYLLQALSSLAVVVGLIYASYLLLRRLQDKPDCTPDGGALEVLASHPLGGGKWLHLVRVGEERFLVGASASTIGPIQPLEKAGMSHTEEADDASLQ